MHDAYPHCAGNAPCCFLLLMQGGLSKATRQLHVSEDVFGGYNHTLRGGQIKYKEYIACGKVRADARGSW